MPIPKSKYEPLDECVALLKESTQLSAELDIQLEKDPDNKDLLGAQETLANSYAALLVVLAFKG